jgi:guanosine-3',5'-bis(diphosphate) 3'-pyrophosphohydrolase
MTDSLASSLRSRLPRIFTRASTSLSTDLAELVRIVKLNHPKSDYQVIERAYRVAEKYHEGQKRKSGEDYITHPLAVARILADLGSGPATIAAALLHDTVEDTEYSLEQLREDFGEEVALLVDGVTNWQIDFTTPEPGDSSRQSLQSARHRKPLRFMPP